MFEQNERGITINKALAWTILVSVFEGWIEADGDKSRHMDCRSQDGATAVNEGFAAPLAGLPCHLGEACEGGRVFGVH